MHFDFNGGFKFGMGFWLAFIIWGAIPGVILWILIMGMMAAMGGHS